MPTVSADYMMYIYLKFGSQSASVSRNSRRAMAWNWTGSNWAWIEHDSSHESWKCKLCQQTTWGKKQKCTTCGALKKWAEAGGQTSYADSGVSELTKAISEAVKKEMGAAANAPPASNAAPTINPQTQETKTRAELISQLQAVESALSSLPESEAFRVSRTPLVQQQTELKKRIRELKPLGAQLDGCKAGIARARKRKGGGG